LFHCQLELHNLVRLVLFHYQLELHNLVRLVLFHHQLELHNLVRRASSSGAVSPSTGIT
jgi:hypothetical protein